MVSWTKQNGVTEMFGGGQALGMPWRGRRGDAVVAVFERRRTAAGSWRRSTTPLA